ncbi:hypothetical protein T4E_7195 [Trichinella pseudospiralis]|uniref:Uncharacterized protein n=1 Tax=Trichinella pseudospiralis TaxID=6337 RepID=A0A0V0YMB7_TRIPS|nr:hypothetical protein T4E_7195 [Trichinella pseudospiralis]
MGRTVVTILYYSIPWVPSGCTWYNAKNLTYELCCYHLLCLIMDSWKIKNSLYHLYQTLLTLCFIIVFPILSLLLSMNKVMFLRIAEIVESHKIA